MGNCTASEKGGSQTRGLKTALWLLQHAPKPVPPTCSFSHSCASFVQYSNVKIAVTLGPGRPVPTTILFIRLMEVTQQSPPLVYSSSDRLLVIYRCHRALASSALLCLTYFAWQMQGRGSSTAVRFCLRRKNNPKQIQADPTQDFADFSVTPSKRQSYILGAGSSRPWSERNTAAWMLDRAQRSAWPALIKKKSQNPLLEYGRADRRTTPHQALLLRRTDRRKDHCT